LTYTTIPWIVVIGFGAFFIFAATREILHRRKHGPPENPRDAFDFDTDAPSYEEPEPTPEPDAETDERQDDPDSDGAPEDTTDADPEDRNETPR
jgi:hypothetical protein